MPPYFYGEYMDTLLINANNDEVLKPLFEAGKELAEKHKERAQFAMKIIDDIEDEKNAFSKDVWPKIEARLIELKLIENTDIRLRMHHENGDIVKREGQKGEGIEKLAELLAEAIARK